MKTKVTLTIDEDLLPAAKQFAQAQGFSLSELVERSLRSATAQSGKSFSARWRGKFRPSEREDERYRQLADKYL